MADAVLKAFSVTEEYENTGGIIFAKTAVEARRYGANEYADGEFSNVSCRRAPWADGYHDKALPIGLMVDHGWHFECGHCGKRIDNDLLCENGWSADDIIGTQHSLAYCNAICEARDKLDAAIRDYHSKRWMRRFCKIVKRRFPDVEPVPGHSYVSMNNGKPRVEQVSVAFDFPGREYSLAQLRWDRNSSWPDERRKPRWSISSGDNDAFRAFASAQKPLSTGPTS